MPITSDLTTDLKKVVLELEDDLRQRVETQPEVKGRWVQQHQGAIDSERTATSWQAWRDDMVTQAVVAWVLTTVFVRFCEDNRLLKPVWLAGPQKRRQEALDAELADVRAAPEHNQRDWLLNAIDYLQQVPAMRALVADDSALWTVSPSGPAAKRLVEFWRATDDDGQLIRDFTDPELSTRFLGDLYQDLSEHAKKTYALLQTPEFVEEFILDQTMEPALKERPLEGFKLIDPTCGSGHFLLGAFDRLVDRWKKHSPGINDRQLVQNALDSVYGVDRNAFAVAIARFRLIVAALRKSHVFTLEDAPGFTLHLATGDSLLHGQHQREIDLDGYDHDSSVSGFAYSTEDLEALQHILTVNSYDAVVGNPPYITVKDRTLKAAYRALYPITCTGKWTLSAPFIQRFFQLAKPRVADHPSGWVGQINSNAFVSREFGVSVIERYLSSTDLRLIVDTSGAYIPGHGTPTVILIGRHQDPTNAEVTAVLGVRGEPRQPPDPARGLVWSAIISNVKNIGFEGRYVSVESVPRESLSRHPWSLAGGGAGQLVALLNKQRGRLGSRIHKKVGFASFPGTDDAFFAPHDALRRTVADQSLIRQVITGDVVRDWDTSPGQWSFTPYDAQYKLIPLDPASPWYRRQWRTRTSLKSVSGFEGESKVDTWWGWYRWVASRYRVPLSIAFAEVATHNHFVLDRGGKVFKQTAPVIKLPKESTEDDHLALLGVLNSSTACFWLKQKCHNKGSTVDTKGARQTQVAWENFYQFNGTKVQDFPLARRLPTRRARSLDTLAQQFSATLPEALVAEQVPTAEVLKQGKKTATSVRQRMIAEQEELDWQVYLDYGITDQDLTYHGDDLPEIALGERAFEIALARRAAAGEEETAWFTRHGSTPITEIPQHWPAAYRDLVQRRLDLIESDRFIGLLEKPEHKRRWQAEPWEKQVDRALRGWLLDRLEDTKYWLDRHGRPTPQSVAQLSDKVSRDADLVAVLELWTGTKDQTVTSAMTALLTDEVVPYLAAYRLKEPGMRKRQAWEHTWELQCREDAGEHVGTIPVPPKYTTADFRKASYWHHRGKLDVPKERFIVYPGASRDTDPTMTIGWAGWDHAQQATAIATLIVAREGDGWVDDKLIPLVAGLAELQPWVQQWHNRIDPVFATNMAEYCGEQLRDRAAQVGLTIDELHAWRPAPTTRGRRRKA